MKQLILRRFATEFADCAETVIKQQYNKVEKVGAIMATKDKKYTRTIVPGTGYTAPRGSVSVRPVEPKPRVGFFEGIAISLAGFRDRFRYKAVKDSDHTMWTQRVLAGARQNQRLVERWRDDVVAAIEAESSRLRLLAGQDIATSSDAPSRQSLAGADRKGRFDWANQVRRAEQDRSQAASESARKQGAQERLAELEAEQVSVLADAMRLGEAWEEYYNRRAAKYARARTGLFGYRALEASSVPEFIRPEPRPAQRWPEIHPVLEKLIQKVDDERAGKGQ